MPRELRLTPGSTFAGVYQVVALLGQGTMGSVYRVLEQPSNTPRALKLMKAELAAEPKFAQRFEQEARIGETIKSDHIVNVVASGLDPKSGMHWLVMELLDGQTLAEWLERTPPPPRAVARHVLDQLFEALAAAHVANVVHRDLKPENIVLVASPPESPPAPFVKVLDFGIAKIVKESTLTGTTPGLGTPLWTAPEQSEDGARIRPAADVWALGLLTFRMLTGKIFWKASNDRSATAFDIALELMRAPIPLASARATELAVSDSLPPAFDAWFSRCVDRDPAARFADAAQAHTHLTAVLEGRVLRPEPEPVTEPDRPPPARPPPRAVARTLAMPAAPAADIPAPRSPARLVALFLLVLVAGAAVGLGVARLVFRWG